MAVGTEAKRPDSGAATEESLDGGDPVEPPRGQPQDPSRPLGAGVNAASLEEARHASSSENQHRLRQLLLRQRAQGAIPLLNVVGELLAAPLPPPVLRQAPRHSFDGRTACPGTPSSS